VDEHSGRRLARSTAIFSLATGLSRILGLVREVVARNYFGVRGPINAFEIAFLIPNTVRALLADAALSSAFVPVFSELLEKGERRRAWRVASTLVWLILLGLGGLTALFILVAPWVMSPLPYKQSLIVGLSRLLFPLVAILGVTGIVVGILNSYEEFSIPALTPVFWNLVIILGLVLGVPHVGSTDGKLYVYAGSIVVATVVQLLLPLPWLRGRDGRLQLVIDWRDPAVRKVFALMIPVSLGLGLININALIDALFAAKLIDPQIAPSAINAAFRLYMLPQGMFSVAIATVLFPTLSRLAVRRDVPGFRSTVSLGLRQIAFLLVPASVVSAALAEPTTRIVYQRGHFAPSQTPVVAAALDAAFYRFGTWGIPLSTSIVNLAGTAVLLVLLRRRLVRLELRETTDSLLRIIAASVLLGGACFGTWYGLDQAFGRSFGAQVVSVGTALIVGTVVYLAACRALKVRELGALLALRTRFKRV
jgi:putative peptidoglycan lipid II flippase